MKDKNRFAAIDAIDAYVNRLYHSPEMDTTTQIAIVDLVTDLLNLADHYRTEGYGDVDLTAEQIITLAKHYRAVGIG